MTIPKPLAPGARVALVAPSGPQPPQHFAAAVQSVKDLGLQPVVYPSCQLEYGYLAGQDADRAKDVNEAFADDTIDGIICIRGGYGAHRLMPLIDFDAICKTPKRLFGYSDITALHIELNQRCDFVSFHTSMPGTEWYNGLDGYSLACQRNALFGSLAGVLQNPPGVALQSLSPGCAQGRICGGNLSLVAATLGTSYEIDTKGKLLFLEDVDEEPYTIDRMLTQLRGAGKLRDAAGILFGPFTNCEGKKEKKCLAMEQIFADLLPVGEKPIVSGLQCGHVLPTACLPMGGMARLDADSCTLEILEG